MAQEFYVRCVFQATGSIIEVHLVSTAVFASIKISMASTESKYGNTCRDEEAFGTID